MSLYDDVRSDHEYLWETYGPADDMTGGYEDQRDLYRLLRSPTKRTATDCYASQIRYWFQKGPDLFGCDNPDWQSDPRVRDIAEIYASTHDLERIVWTGDAAYAS